MIPEDEYAEEQVVVEPRKPQQLQFSFMRDVNLHCYLHKQVLFYHTLYDNFQRHSPYKTVPYTAYIEQLLHTDIPKHFHEENHKIFFSDLDDIVEDIWHKRS